jgi:hypothetical protein
MTPDTQPSKTSRHRSAKYVAAVTWDDGLWNVRVPNYSGEGVTFTTADSLAEVVPNASVVLGVALAANPMHLVANIGVEVQLPDEIVKALRVAASLIDDATDELRQIGLSEGDITTVLAGDPSVPGHSKPGNPVPLLRSRDSGPADNANGASSRRSPESLATVLVQAAERLRSDPEANFDHGAVRGAIGVLADRVNDRLTPPRPPSGEGRDDLERP